MASTDGNSLFGRHTGRFNVSESNPQDDPNIGIIWHHTLAVRAPFSTTLVLLSVCAIVCNVLVLVTLTRTRRLRTMNSVFLANMASVDLTIGAFVIPTALYHSIVNKDEYQPILCKAFAFIWSTLSKSCVLTVAAIAFDRHQAVINCLRYTTTRRKSYACWGLIWIWTQSILCSMAPLVGWSRFQYVPDRFLCTIDWDYSWSYTLFAFVTCYLVPVGMVLVCYARVWYTAQQHVKRLAATHLQRGRLQSTYGQDPREHHGPERKPALKRKSSVLQYAVVDPIHRVSMFPSIQQWGNNAIRSDLYSYTGIRALYNLEGTEGGPAGGFKSHYRASFRLALQVLVLILCWLPLFILTLLSTGGIAIPGGLISAFTLLSFTGPVTNPIIYALGSRTFRRALRHLSYRTSTRNFGLRNKHDIVVEQIAKLYNRKSSQETSGSSIKRPPKHMEVAVEESDSVSAAPSSTSEPYVICHPTIVINTAFSDDDTTPALALNDELLDDLTTYLDISKERGRSDSGVHDLNCMVRYGSLGTLSSSLHVPRTPDEEFEFVRISRQYRHTI